MYLSIPKGKEKRHQTDNNKQVYDTGKINSLFDFGIMYEIGRIQLEIGCSGRFIYGNDRNTSSRKYLQPERVGCPKT